MRRRTIKYRNRIGSLLFLLRIVAYVCGIVGLCMLFSKNTRVEMIKTYNSRVREWESDGLLDLQNASFYLSHDNIVSEFNVISEGFGEFYPYRDSCNKLSDPKCLNSTVNYYSLSAPLTEGEDFSLSILTDNYSVLFEDVLDGTSTAYLNKMEISCSGGNSETCTRACRKHSGIWNEEKKLCIVHMYLSAICLRIFYNNATDVWSIDMPPHASWLPDDASFGCEPSDSENLYQFHNDSSWLPFFYSSTPPSEVKITLRHYQDPFIVAAEVTRGCSSSSVEALFCFGKSVEEDRVIAFGLMGIAGLGLLSSFVMYLIRRRLQRLNRRVPSWLCPSWIVTTMDDGNEQDSKGPKGKRNDFSGDLGKDTTDEYDAYDPIMQMREEDTELGFNLGEAEVVLENPNYHVVSEFEGDSSGI